MIQEILSIFDENLKSHKKQRPFILLSYAQSIDGYLGHKLKSTKISCSEAFKLTHLLRSKVDAILVGINTVLIDNPKLTVRLNEFGFNETPLENCKNPVPVVLDRRLRIPKDSNLYNRAIVFHDTDATNLNENFVKCIDLDKIMNILYERGIRSVMVEGGPTVLAEFFKYGYDLCIVTIGSKLLGSGNRISFDEAEKNVTNLSTFQVGPDTVIVFK